MTTTTTPISAYSTTVTGMRTAITATPAPWVSRPLSTGSPATVAWSRQLQPRSSGKVSRLGAASTHATVLTPVGLLVTERTNPTGHHRRHLYTMATCSRKDIDFLWTRMIICSQSRPTRLPTWIWSEVCARCVLLEK